MIEQRWRWWVLGAILLGWGWRLGFFGLSVTHLPPSSDEALSPLQARQILDGHRPLLVLANPYQFPVESYLAAPLVRALPPTALGARLLPFGLGLLAVGLLLGLVRRLGSWRETWPGWLLVLFPSAYLLMLESAYFIPQHSSFLVLSTLALGLAHGARQRPQRPLLWPALAGLAAGLAFSNHALALPFVLAAAALVVLAGSGRLALRAAPAFAAGLGVGLLPYLLARLWLPGAYDAVTGLVPGAMALRRLWSPLCLRTLPSACGLNPPLFPDSKHLLGQWPGAEPFFSAALLLLLAVATGVCAVRFLRRTRAGEWPWVELEDVVVGVCWIGLALNALSARSLSNTFRYLLPVVWVWPLVLAALYARAGRRGRWALGLCALGLLALNLTAGAGLMRQWARPGFAAEQANIFDLRPVRAFLQAHGLRHVYASYWAAYRLRYEAAGALCVSQPYNERFFAWPVPWKPEVDAATNVAYVLAPRTSFPPERLAQDLAAMGAGSRREACGDFQVFYDFQPPPAWAGIAPVSADALRATAGANPAEACRLVDGAARSRWGSGRAQARGLWIEARLATPQRLCAVRLAYDGYPFDQARALRVSVQSGGAWRVVQERVAQALDRFAWRNGHPVYGALAQTISFPPVAAAEAVRVEIVEPAPGRDWSVGELQLWTSAARP